MVEEIVKYQKEKELKINDFILANQMAREKFDLLKSTQEKYIIEVNNLLLELASNEYDFIETVVILEKYVNRKSLSKIAKEYKYSNNYIKNVHKRAIDKLKKEK